MKCFCITSKFPKPLLKDQEDVLISFFQRSIEEGTEQSKKMANMAKSFPGVGKKTEILDTMKTYMEMQKKFFSLEKVSEDSYMFVMPSMSRELVKLRGYGLKFPDVRVRPIKKTLENHVFKEMGARGIVLIKEEEREISKDRYGKEVKE